MSDDDAADVTDGGPVDDDESSDTTDNSAESDGSLDEPSDGGPVEVHDPRDETRRAIEAVLLVATDPTPTQLLAQLLELPIDQVDERCRALAAGYEAEGRGFQLVEVAGGWRYQTHPDLHPYVERYALEGVPNRLSGAALETMAIVAYKQPISRAQISAIRGVSIDGVLRTLIERGYVEEYGKDDGPGQATLFGTTPFFLEQVGLMSTHDLPALGDFVPSAEVLEALEQTLRIEGEPPTTSADGDDGADQVDGSGPDEGERQAEDQDVQSMSDQDDDDSSAPVVDLRQPTATAPDDGATPSDETEDDPGFADLGAGEAVANGSTEHQRAANGNLVDPATDE